jgi:hypothetical protein
VNAAELAGQLGGARREGREWRCRCPAHDDHDPSLSICEKDGQLLFKCRTGCDQAAVLEALRQRKLWPDRDNARPRIVATYSYRDEHGALRYQVVRREPKDFRQRRPNGSPESWLWNMQGVEPLPYRLPELLGDPDAVVFIAEGEKDVDNLAELGLVSTTNHGGAGKWRDEISRWLAGRHVVIVPDNDDTGRTHARDVAQKLTGTAASVRILELPGLPAKGDVSDWLAVGGTADELDRLASLASGDGAEPPTPTIDVLRVSNWLTRDISEPDFMLGELLSTTSRIELIGPTGLGKTNFLLAWGMAIADGSDFLHWRGGGKPRRVLYIDGEMSRRLMKKRIADAVRRHGSTSTTFFVLNREDFADDLGPLNNDPGQAFIDRTIDALGGVDCVILDNVQSLLSGDMKDEEPWQQVLPWVRDLTRRNIGQIWVHHTGHDESHGYGSKTREWQLDTVCLMETVDRPEADIAFAIKFTKARERSPENRSDFDKAVITLARDEWASERTPAAARKGTAKDRALDVLIDTLARHGQIPPANEHIPPNTSCVADELWTKACEMGLIGEGDPDSTARAIRRAKKTLLDRGLIGKWAPWVWVVR